MKLEELLQLQEKDTLIDGTQLYYVQCIDKKKQIVYIRKSFLSGAIQIITMDYTLVTSENVKSFNFRKYEF